MTGPVVASSNPQPILAQSETAASVVSAALVFVTNVSKTHAPPNSRQPSHDPSRAISVASLPTPESRASLDLPSQRAGSCPLPDGDASPDAQYAMIRDSNSRRSPHPVSESLGFASHAAGRQLVADDRDLLSSTAMPIDDGHISSVAGHADLPSIGHADVDRQAERRDSVAGVDDVELSRRQPTSSARKLPESHIRAVQLQSTDINEWRKSQLPHYPQSKVLSATIIQTMLTRTKHRLHQLDSQFDTATRYRLGARIDHLMALKQLIDSKQITVHAVLGWGDGATGSPPPNLSISEYDSLIISTPTMTTPFILSLGSNIQHHAAMIEHSPLNEGRDASLDLAVRLHHSSTEMVRSSDSPKAIASAHPIEEPTVNRQFDLLSQFGTLWIPCQELPRLTDQSAPSSPAAGALVLQGTGDERWEIIRYRSDASDQPPSEG